ncbi:hypothetical protein ACWDUX_05485 [Streptomyces sp. NPDC003444]
MERGISVDNEAGVVVVGDGNDVVLGAGAPVRSAYREQVRRIAPPELVDREEELAELVDFCRRREPGYVWWRAEAWAGKTALLSWFALHPPQGVRIVPFFVTARLGAQNDIVGYVDVVLEQLAELVGEGLPTRLTDATKAAHLMRLYAEASRICAERDERLVLLVDGLDEDRGVTGGADAYSIASLLPHTSDVDIRVIVAGRLNPPLPGDVADTHPLRGPGVVRTLRPSSYARVVRHEAERELKAFLADGRHSRDILGLVVASGDGLTSEDLAHLTDTTVYEIKDLLRTRAGRTFAVRGVGASTTARRDSYILAHEELHAQAREMLGESFLETSRARLHEWSEEYRAKGWPPDTPDYLLKGYFQLLRDTGELGRMIRCALDDARGDRLLDTTGNDGSGLAELRVAGEGIVAGEEARLVDMLQISVRRRALETRTFRMPVGLPAAWVMAGLPRRGESLARGIPEREERARALTAVGTVLAELGDAESAGVAFYAAEEAASEMRELPAQRRVAEKLAQACLRAHRFVQVKRLVDASDGMVAWPPSAIGLVDRLAGLGGAERVVPAVRALSCHPVPRFDDIVVALAEMGEVPEAVAMARSHDVSTWRAVGLLRIAGVLRRKASGMGRLLVQEALANSALFGDRIVQALIEAGEMAEGAARALALTYGERQSSDFTAIVGALAEAGDARTVDILLSRLQEGTQLSEAAAAAARWAAEHDDVDRSMRLARVITDDEALTRALLAAATAKVRHGDADDGVAIARMLSEQDRSAGPVVDIAMVLAECGEQDRARQVLADVESGLRARPPQHALHELAAIAEALATCGHHTEARRILGGVESCLAGITRSLRGTWTVGAALVEDVVKALAGARLFEAAERVASVLTSHPDAYDLVLVEISRRMVDQGEFEKAERIAWTQVGLSSSRLVTEVARALAAAGEWRRATRVASQGMAPYHRPWLLSEFAGLRMVEGRHEAAAGLLLAARERTRQAPSIRGAAGLVRASVRIGDWGTARLAMGETEALIGRAALSGGALKDVLRALVALGEYDKAEALVERVASPSAQAEAKADLVDAFLEHGHRHRAQAVVDTMRYGREVGRAYEALARTVDGAEAKALLIRALRRGWWTQCLTDLLRVEPGAVPVVLGEADRLRKELGIAGDGS